jgi:hypothetical protein
MKNKKPTKGRKTRKFVQQEIPFPVDPGQDEYVKAKRIRIGEQILEKYGIKKSKNPK